MNKNDDPMIGQKFGRLTVLCKTKRPERIKHRETWFHCLCDCGNYKDVSKSHLKRGAVLSCGCYNVERATKHGMSGSRIYRIWAQVKDRCINKNNKHYYCYGGRGITYSADWELFENFRDWAVSNGYEDNLTIDRVDPNGNYEPSNCRWVSMKTQGRNRRNNVKYTIDGETLCLSELCEKYGVSRSLVESRLGHGWDIIRAIKEPPRWHRPDLRKERNAS